jgi:tRNA isopentenyl-2-thiomethyl-A-37 hydroxylase MiaE
MQAQAPAQATVILAVQTRTVETVTTATTTITRTTIQTQAKLWLITVVWLRHSVVYWLLPVFCQVPEGTEALVFLAYEFAMEYRTVPTSRTKVSVNRTVANMRSNANLPVVVFRMLGNVMVTRIVLMGRTNLLHFVTVALVIQTHNIAAQTVNASRNFGSVIWTMIVATDPMNRLIVVAIVTVRPAGVVVRLVAIIDVCQVGCSATAKMIVEMDRTNLMQIIVLNVKLLAISVVTTVAVFRLVGDAILKTIVGTVQTKRLLLVLHFTVNAAKANSAAVTDAVYQLVGVVIMMMIVKMDQMNASVLHIDVARPNFNVLPVIV